MSPLSKSGKYFSNPAVMREHEKSASAEKHETEPNARGLKSQMGESGGDNYDEPAKKVEIERKEEGGYHTVTHHADGREEHADHEDIHEATAHAHEQFHEDPTEQEETDEPEETEEEELTHDGGMHSIPGLGRADDGAM